MAVDRRVTIAVLASFAATALLAAAGCERAGEKASSPPKSAVSAPPGPAATPGPDTTPKASEVMPAVPPPTDTAKHDDATGPATPMSKAEENTSMPKSGQANDHSTPGAGSAAQK